VLQIYPIVNYGWWDLRFGMIIGVRDLSTAIQGFWALVAVVRAVLAAVFASAAVSSKLNIG
jgi:hypothetical protein